MKLACKDLSDTECNFSVEADTKEEAAQKMLAHARQDHAQDIEGMSDEEVIGVFSAKVHD